MSTGNLMTDQLTSYKKYYSVEWPENWAVSEIRENNIIKSKFSKIVTFVGGRPKKQTTFYQHGIFVSEAPLNIIIEEIHARQTKNNGKFIGKEAVKVDGKPASKFSFANKVDPTNKQTFYVLETDQLIFVIEIHGPSDHATYLNEASNLLLRTFKIK